MNQKQILLEFTKSEFMNFLQNDSKGKILEIINDEGIVILEKSDRKKERINYILSFSKYVDELFQNPKFLDMFLNSEINDSSTLNHLKKETYDLLLKRSIELQKDSNYISRLFKKFNTEYKINVLNNWPYSIELLYKILETDEAIVVQKIMDTYNIDLTNYNDTGVMLSDLKTQPVYAGASGPVCAPLVTYGFIFDEMRKGKYKKVLLAATGALMSPVMVNHKLSIPAISHAVSLEVML